MALDIRSIPAMFTEPERLISGPEITITDRRNRVGIASVQAIECLKSWMATTSTPYVDANTGTWLVQTVGNYSWYHNKAPQLVQESHGI